MRNIMWYLLTFFGLSFFMGLSVLTITIVKNHMVGYSKRLATKRWKKFEKYHNNGHEFCITRFMSVMVMRFRNLLGKYNQVWYLKGDNHNFFVGSTGRGRKITVAELEIESSLRKLEQRTDFEV